MIRYLLKFCPKLEYAQDLIAGKLYMNSAYYYRGLVGKDGGIGDIAESAMSHKHDMSKNGDFPIYCMTAVEDDDLVDGNIVTTKRMVEKFGCKDGYIVAIPYDEFFEKFKSINTLCCIEHGKVKYGNITLADTRKLFTSKDFTNLFIKRAKFDYQKEYRIVIGEHMPAKIEQRYHENGVLQSAVIGYDAKTYNLKNGLVDIARIFKVSELKEIEEKIYIPIRR